MVIVSLSSDCKELIVVWFSRKTNTVNQLATTSTRHEGSQSLIPSWNHSSYSPCVADAVRETAASRMFVQIGRNKLLRTSNLPNGKRTFAPAGQLFNCILNLIFKPFALSCEVTRSQPRGTNSILWRKHDCKCGAEKICATGWTLETYSFYICFYYLYFYIWKEHLTTLKYQTAF